MKTEKRSSHKESIPMWVPSMGALATLLDIPPAWLTLAKRRGCKAFEPTRCNVLDAVRYLLRVDKDFAGENWDEILKSERAKLVQVQRRNMEGDLVDKKKTMTQWSRLLENMRDQLLRFLRDEQPMKLEGLRAAQIAAYNEEFIDRVLAGLRSIDVT